MPISKRQSIWTLPEGIDDLLPAEADKLEICRFNALAHMKNWGYELVYPPILEYLDSLLQGMDPELNLSTMKMVDQSTGRTVGVPADITPQIARIESFMTKQEISRLCYVGPVLRANSSHYPGSRNPIQIGAELFGHEGPDGDVEIINLLYDLLKVLRIDEPVIELSDMGLFRNLCCDASIDELAKNEILDALLRRDLSDLQQSLTSCEVASSFRSKFEALLELNGSLDILLEAEKLFKGTPRLLDGVFRLKYVAESLSTINPMIDIKIDLSELRGYKYHSSTSFIVHVENLGRPLCWGGRYDYLSPRDGITRPGTGFSADLKSLSRVSQLNVGRSHEKIALAPAVHSGELRKLINRLRKDGYIVIQQLPGEDFKHSAQSATIQMESGSWVLKEMK